MITVDGGLSGRFKHMALLCAFLVVVIHCTSNFNLANVLICDAVRDGVCRIAVPFFFFASGFFLIGNSGGPGWWRVAIGKRIHSLLIPYVLFNFAYWLLRYFLMHNIEFSVSEAINAFGLNPFQHPICQPLWYVRALFILVLVAPIVLRLMECLDCKMFTGAFCLLAFLLYGWFGAYEGVGGADNLFRKFLAMQGLFYMSCGMMFRKGALNVLLSRRRALWCLLIGSCLMIVKCWLQYRGSDCYYYVGWVSIPVLANAVFNLVPSQAVPDSILVCAFPIYVLHPFVLRFFCKVGDAVGVSWGKNVFVWSFATLCAFSITVLAVWIQRKMFPRLNRIVWGGR